MTDTIAAGSSSSAGSDKQQLAEADEKYKAGMASLRANDLNKAVELLGTALQARTQAHGDLAPECASAYHHYGTAIFYKAQEEQDVFGAPLQQAAEEQDDDKQEKDIMDNFATETNTVDEKGKAPLKAEDLEATEERDEPEDDDDGDEDDVQEGGPGDMQLAWETLEAARSIYSKMGDEKGLDLADVHVLLGDIGLEEERFDSSAIDYESALKLLMQKLEADDRRIAEAHYKLALTLHFLEDPEKALEHANKAVAVCNTRIARLSAPKMSAGSATELSPGAEHQSKAPSVCNTRIARLSAPNEGNDSTMIALSGEEDEKEIAELCAVLEDLAAKVEDLEAAVNEKEATRKALRDAFSQVAGSFSGGASGSASAQPPSEPTASTVVNLGVVGRGSKRINLQPIDAAAPAGTNVAGAATEPAQKPKRSFEDIMGGGAATSLGFGSALTVPQGFGASSGTTSPAAGNVQMVKKPKAEGATDTIPAAMPASSTDASEGSTTRSTGAIPAFLQAGQVAKTYGQQASQPPARQN